MIPGLALDIDETLSDTNIFWFTKLSELFGNPEGLLPREIAAKYRYSQQVPYWQTPEALVWMEEARHGNELQVALPLIANAKQMVKQINTILPIVAYVTARPVSVREGTLRWLATHGFPEAPLIMKPLEIPNEEGVAWKANFLAAEYPNIRGIVDDHPGLVDALPADYRGTIFLYNYTGPVSGGRNVIVCPTWDDVYAAVLKKMD